MKKKQVAIIYALMYLSALIVTLFLMEPGENPLPNLKDSGGESLLLIFVFPLGVVAIFCYLLGKCGLTDCAVGESFARLVALGSYLFCLIHFFHTFYSENARRHYVWLLILLALVLCLNIGGCAMIWNELSGIH